MKFKVREGFVVIHQEPVHDDPKDEKRITSYNEIRFPEGKTVEFVAEDAEKHRHKLEPLDTEAKKFLESRFAPVVAAAGVPAGLADTIAAAIAQAVSAGVAAAMKAQAQAK